MNEDDLRNALTRLAGRASAGPDALERVAARKRARDVRRRVSGAVAALAAAAAVALVVVQTRPPGEPTPPGGFATEAPGPAPTSGTHPLAVASKIAYSYDDDVYAYDFDGEPRLVSGSSEHSEYFPFPHADGRVWLILEAGDGGLESGVWQVDLTSGEKGSVVDFEFNELVNAIAYRPDRIAYILNRGFSRQTLYLLDLSDPRVVEAAPDERDSFAAEVWTFPTYSGRGTSSDDEVSVAWSPDGTKLLVVNTWIDTAEERANESVLVLTPEGEQVVPPRDGTHARWLDDGSVLYKRLPGKEWVVLDIATGEERALAGLPETGDHPSVSPEGTRLAMDDASESPTVVAYEIATGRVEEVAPGAVAPLWLDEERVVVTLVEPCVECEGPRWQPAGQTMVVDLDTGRSDPFPIASTLDARVLWSVTYGSEE